MASKSQRKGRKAECELTEILNSYGYDVHTGRALNYGTQPDILGLQNVHIEVKRCEALRLSAWVRQAVRDSQKFKDGEPAIFHRRNREGWLVTMPLESWLRIYDKSCNETN